MLLFGGAAHDAEWDDARPYGSNVVDLASIEALDTTHMIWIPSRLTSDRFRGGVNAAFDLGKGQFLMTGGMHSDIGAPFPTFKDDVATLSFTLG